MSAVTYPNQTLAPAPSPGPSREALAALIAELRPVVPAKYQEKIDAVLDDDVVLQLQVGLGDRWTKLSPKQQGVAIMLRSYQMQHGHSPTLQQLADSLKVSKVTIFEHISGMEQKGVLNRDKHKARSLELLMDGKAGQEQAKMAQYGAQWDRSGRAVARKGAPCT